MDLAVIRLPRISNFTDFNVLESMPGVTVRYVDSAAALGGSGSDSAAGNEKYHGRSVMDAAERPGRPYSKHAAAGKPVFGICGGYQMLGRVLKDPYGVEHGGEMAGMGLLPFW